MTNIFEDDFHAIKAALEGDPEPEPVNYATLIRVALEAAVEEEDEDEEG